MAGLYPCCEEGRKKLTTLVFGSEQERALRSAATAAVQRSVEELRPDEAEQAELRHRLVINQVFGEPVPGEPLANNSTVLEAVQAGIAQQLAVLDGRQPDLYRAVLGGGAEDTWRDDGVEADRSPAAGDCDPRVPRWATGAARLTN